MPIKIIEQNTGRTYLAQFGLLACIVTLPHTLSPIRLVNASFAAKPKSGSIVSPAREVDPGNFDHLAPNVIKI